MRAATFVKRKHIASVCRWHTGFYTKLKTTLFVVFGGSLPASVALAAYARTSLDATDLVDLASATGRNLGGYDLTVL